MANKTWVGTDTGNEGDWSVAANWSPSGVPVATDDVRIPAGSNAITAGLNQSAVALGDVIVEEGYTAAIGTSAADLQIDPNRFEFAGTGVAYIDLGTAAIDVLVKNTASVGNGTGLRGLYLKGSAIAILSVEKGQVGVASIFGTTATVTTARILGGDVWIGEGCTLTTLQVFAGSCELRAAATTVTVYGGTFTSEEQGAITTVNLKNGNAILNSTGTITTLNADGGSVDFMQSGLARTVTTLKMNPGTTVKYDPNSMTITNTSESDDPMQISTSPA